MDNNPLFSVVIPTYNHGHLINRCIDSLIAQTYTNWEAVIVNNFSTDNTAEVVKSYDDPRIRLVNNANNGIIAVSRNKGIELSNGDWICFLDSDDWWTPNKLKCCLEYINDYDLIYHDMGLVNSYGSLNRILKSREINKKNFILDCFTNNNPIINSSVTVRKRIVDEVGYLTESKDLITVEDFDYWLRIMSITNRLKYIAMPLGFYWLGSNASANISHIEKEQNLVLKYIHCFSDEDKEMVNKSLDFRSARIYHKNSEFILAIESYLKAIHYKSKCLDIFKAVIGIMLCLLRIKK